MQQRIRSFVASLARDQRGLTTVEYAIILCLIVAVTVGSWDSLGARIAKELGTSTTNINGAFEPGAPDPG